MPYSIKTAQWQTDCASLAYIREQVFMREQHVSAEDEWDGKDEGAIHFLVCDPLGNALGCARILTELHHTKPCFHIGRVAILKEYRAQGLGQQLMQTMIAWCQQHQPAAAIFLHAQTERIAFYRHLGFAPKGEVFMDAGIPHIEMWYRIAN